MRCPVYPWVHPRSCRMLRGRGGVSRRSKSASFELTMLPLSQAWHLGGLHHAAPVPFRSSSFTAGLHPPAATLQRLAAYLYRRWGFPPIPSLRFRGAQCLLPPPAPAPLCGAVERRATLTSRGLLLRLSTSR